MLYKFKSRATADLLMLEPQGRQVLSIMGKTPSPQGIVTLAQIPQAIADLEAAIAAEAAGTPPAIEEPLHASDDEESENDAPVVQLRQRAVPLIDMLRRSQAQGCDVVWGV